MTPAQPLLQFINKLRERHFTNIKNKELEGVAKLRSGGDTTPITITFFDEFKGRLTNYSELHIDRAYNITILINNDYSVTFEFLTELETNNWNIVLFNANLMDYIASPNKFT